MLYAYQMTQLQIINPTIETFRMISGFPNYQISNMGRVMSMKTLKIMKQQTRSGYSRISLTNETKSYTFSVHRLVCQEFLPNPENKLFVDHINNVTNDNRLENLRYATGSQNSANTTKQENTTSKYKGVSLCKNTKKWRASIMINKKHFFLGYFTEEQAAAEAYNKKAFELFGEFAKLNVIE